METGLGGIVEESSQYQAFESVASVGRRRG